MTTLPLPESLTAESLTTPELRGLAEDAFDWRALRAGLAAKGFAGMEMDVPHVLAVFPDYSQLARGSTPPTLDDLLRAVPPVLPMLHAATLTHVSDVEVRVFGEAETTLGPVEMGYTDSGHLAFTFARSGETYLVPFAAVLNQLIVTLAGRAPIWTRRTAAGQ